jgi:hypothetical protein
MCSRNFRLFAGRTSSPRCVPSAILGPNTSFRRTTVTLVGPGPGGLCSILAPRAVARNCSNTNGFSKPERPSPDIHDCCWANPFIPLIHGGKGSGTTCPGGGTGCGACSPGSTSNHWPVAAFARSKHRRYSGLAASSARNSASGSAHPWKRRCAPPSVARKMLFFDGRRAKRAWPVVGEYIRPNVKPKKSNSPSGTLQMRVLSSFTVSFSLPMISRRRCSAASALPLRHKITRLSA